jgi:ATP-dependent RNA helicase RhlE
LKEGIKAAAIHGNKSQNARQNALSGFKAGKLRILVATDIAARGIDIDELANVFNYDLPNIPETYVHRIGRTGRAGNSGIAISFCDGETLKELKEIQKLIGITIPVIEKHPFPMAAGSMEKSEPPKAQKNHQKRRFQRR